MQTHVASGGYGFDRHSVGGRWSWFVRANNIQGLGQLYQVVDIITPFGKFQDTFVPIPADIIQAMSQSITDIQQQLSPAVVLHGGTPSTYNITVIEGGRARIVALVPFTNGGAFGSFLTEVTTSDSPWLRGTPSPIVGIGKNQPAQIEIEIFSELLLATDSPYVGHLNLTATNGVSQPVQLTVNVTVLPRSQIQVLPGTLTYTFSISTGFITGPQTVTVTNIGPADSILKFDVKKVQNCSPWLFFNPGHGGPLTSGDSAVVTFTVVPNHIPQPVFIPHGERVGIRHDHDDNVLDDHDRGRDDHEWDKAGEPYFHTEDGPDPDARPRGHLAFPCQKHGRRGCGECPNEGYDHTVYDREAFQRDIRRDDQISDLDPRGDDFPVEHMAGWEFPRPGYFPETITETVAFTSNDASNSPQLVTIQLVLTP